MEVEANRVAHARRDHLAARAVWIEAQHRRADRIRLDVDVGRRPDRHVERLAVRREPEGARPVTGLPARQIRNLRRRAAGLRIASLVGEADDRIGVGDVEAVLPEVHAERLRQAGRELGALALFNRLILVRVAQHVDAARRRVRKEDVAIRRFDHPGADVESLGKRLNLEPLGRPSSPSAGFGTTFGGFGTCVVGSPTSFAVI